MKLTKNEIKDLVIFNTYEYDEEEIREMSDDELKDHFTEEVLSNFGDHAQYDDYDWIYRYINEIPNVVFKLIGVSRAEITKEVQRMEEEGKETTEASDAIYQIIAQKYF